MGNIKNMLIVTGGDIDIGWTKKWLARQAAAGNVFDYCMAVDRGLESADLLGLKVNYLLGDYDSVNAEVLARYRNEVENVMFPREKDYTDTELAVLKAIELFNGDARNVSQDCAGSSKAGKDPAKKDSAGKVLPDDDAGQAGGTVSAPKAVILGATGTRMDHTLSNIGLLEHFHNAGIEAFITDRNNRIRMMSGESEIRIGIREQFGTYVSCIALMQAVIGLTMQGFKYPLNGFELVFGAGICVSNEITEDEAVIGISDGKMLVLETRD